MKIIKKIFQWLHNTHTRQGYNRCLTSTKHPSKLPINLTDTTDISAWLSFIDRQQYVAIPPFILNDYAYSEPYAFICIDLTEWAKQYQQQYIEAIDGCLFNTVIQYSNNARNNQDGGR